MSNLLNAASLVLTPNSYKEGKLYSVIPNTGAGDMTVVRATTATRVNSAGLVELVPYNLVQYSEQFDNAAWAVNTATVTVNTSIAPDGTLTADTITNVSGSLVGQAQNILIGQTFTFSIYLKRINGIGVINLIDVNGNLIPITITNEWNKYYVTSTSTSTLGRAYFRVMTTGDSVAAWGAQLVEGTNALPYQKTETRLNIPRLDYSNGTCPSLLVEPQRTNLALYSNALSTSPNIVDWSTTTANVYVSPDGTQNAMQFTEKTTNDRHGFYQYTNVTAQAYTASIFTKQTGRRYIACTSDMTGTVVTSYFDLQTKSVVSSGSGYTCSIEDFENGWFRLIVTLTATAGSRFVSWGGSPNGTTNSYAGSTSISQTFYGYQLEAGSYPTSYIPTTSASVTRNADVISKTGIADLIGQTEGTVFIDITINSVPNTDLILVGNSTGVVYDIYMFTGGNKIIAAIINNGSYVWAQATTFDFVVGVKYKCAIGYKSGSIVFYINGIQIGSSSSTFVPFAIANKVQLAEQLYSGKQSVSFQSVSIFTTRLTNDQLEALTGLGFNTYAEMASYYNYTLQ